MEKRILICLCFLWTAVAGATGDSKPERESKGQVSIDVVQVQLRCDSQRLQLSFPGLNEISEGHVRFVEHYFGNDVECGNALAQLEEVASALTRAGEIRLQTAFKTSIRLYSYPLNYSERCNESMCSIDVDDRLMIKTSFDLLELNFSGSELLSSTMRTESWPAGMCPPFRPDCDL